MAQRKVILFLELCCLFIICSAGNFSVKAQLPKREFRGIWIATVNNLDWPSEAGMNVDRQKRELVKMIDKLAALNFNAVIFQIRPAADAFYQSETEPWSRWLTGIQGEAPPGNWDPLQFLIDECHLRAIEVHAWMNPFRVSTDLTTPLSPKNIASRHPEWIVTYGNRRQIDPGFPGVRTYLNSVVKEVVERYEVDAIHFDDYFYPYPIQGKPFPDTLSFSKFFEGFKPGDIDHWRRRNVDLIIETIGQTIKSVRPTVKFGISPFGVWKNYEETDELAGSVTQAGNTNYVHLYADVLKWLRNGWIDYLIPQLYWEIGHPSADYITLANWWNERSFSRHIYIGHALYKLKEENQPAWKNKEELPEQITIVRRMKNIRGSAFFRMRHLLDNPFEIQEQLQNVFYPQKALLPTMPWSDPSAPAGSFRVCPKGFFKINKLAIRYPYKATPESDLLGYLVYYSKSKKIVNTNNSLSLSGFFPGPIIEVNKLKIKGKGPVFVWITAIDRHHNESPPVGGIRINLPK